MSSLFCWQGAGTGIAGSYKSHAGELGGEIQSACASSFLSSLASSTTDCVNKLQSTECIK